MKRCLLAAVFSGVIAAATFGDIHDPPGNDYGPTRKLGRGLSNFFLAPAEVFTTVARVNTVEGNAAAAGYGVVRGTWRSMARHGAGLLEILTWPFPTWHDGYYPMLPLDVPYIHAGYAEYPPELGNESKYPYVRDY